MSVEIYLEKTAALRAPIPGASPAGADVTFDPDFEGLKLEIDKLTGLAGAVPNWRQIVSTSREILGAKAKDMRVAAWFCVGRTQESGFEGFAEGMAVMRDLSGNYWDTMFPEAKRARARANLMMWLTDQSCAFLENKDPRLVDGDAIRATDALLAELETVLAEKLADLNPGLNKLRALFRNKVRAIPVPAAEPSADAAPAAEETSGTGVGYNGGDPTPFLTATVDGLLKVASVMRAEGASPFGVRIQRLAAWLWTLKAPTSDDGVTTLIGPPDPDSRRELDSMAAAGNWAGVLSSAEDLTGQDIFWLDPHRYVAQAMDNLGAAYAEARETLGREVVAFVVRVPLTEMKFSDGTAFADDATKTWISEESMKYGAGGGGSAAAAKLTAEDEEVAARMEEAKALVKGGKVGDGVGLALALANRSADARVKFRAHLATARMALDGGRADVARPMLESLLSQIEKHQLESYEPDVCIAVFVSLLTCLKMLNPEGNIPDLYAKQVSIFDKLCRLDPAAAMKFVS